MKKPHIYRMFGTWCAKQGICTGMGPTPAEAFWSLRKICPMGWTLDLRYNEKRHGN